MKKKLDKIGVSMNIISSTQILESKFSEIFKIENLGQKNAQINIQHFNKKTLWENTQWNIR